jgi:hypothetical protein
MKDIAQAAAIEPKTTDIDLSIENRQEHRFFYRPANDVHDEIDLLFDVEISTTHNTNFTSKKKKGLELTV